MYLVFVDFSKNNLLTEQLCIKSFYELPIMNSTLSDINLNTFCDYDIVAAYLTNCDDLKVNPLFKVECIKESELYITLSSLKIEDKVLVFRNDIYLELLPETQKILKSAKGIVCLTNEDCACLGMILTVGDLLNLFTRTADCREIFINAKKIADSFANVGGYNKKLETVNDYKTLLSDILNKKTVFRPPHIAEGVYTEGNVPKGDFSINPPVFLGANVQIESGSSIGPDTVIYNNCLVSQDSVIKNSVLSENVYISSNCFVNGSICCNNSSVKRNSAVFPGSVIGANALIGEDAVLENNSVVLENIKYDKFLKSPFNHKMISFYRHNFQGLSPDKAALLGSAIANIYNKPDVLVATDGSNNANSIKLAFMSGLMCSGAKCFDIGATFKSHIFFCSLFCESNYAVFISGINNGTNIEVYNDKNVPLNSTGCHNLLSYCIKGEFKFTTDTQCKAVRQLKGLKRVYIREIVSLFGNELCFMPSINCKNFNLNKTLEEILKRIAKNSNKTSEISVNFNESGTKVYLKYKDVVYREKDLKRLVFFCEKSRFDSGFLKCDIYNKLWKYDCVFLVICVLDIITRMGKSIKEVMDNLPNFYINSQQIPNKMNNGELAKRISHFDDAFYTQNSYNIPLDDCYVKIVDKSDSGSIKILTASQNLSVAEEIGALFVDLLSEA